VIFVDDVSDNNNQVDDADAFTHPSSVDNLQSCDAHHSSLEFDTRGEDSEHETIFDGLDEYPSHVNYTHSSTPEVPPGHDDERLSTAVDTVSQSSPKQHSRIIYMD
jgi:hypothetical protein